MLENNCEEKKRKSIWFLFEGTAQKLQNLTLDHSLDIFSLNQLFVRFYSIIYIFRFTNINRFIDNNNNGFFGFSIINTSINTINSNLRSRSLQYSFSLQYPSKIIVYDCCHFRIFSSFVY